MKFRIFTLLILIAVVWLSCKGGSDVSPIIKTTTIDVINADSNAINFYQNGIRLNQISSLSPGSASGYLAAPIGTNTYEFKIAGQSNYLISNYSLTLDSGYSYSLFAAGETADKIFLIRDIVVKDSTTVAMVRVVNASPATTNLNVSVGGLSYSNIAFKSASAFKYVPIGTTGVTSVSVSAAGSTMAIATNSVTLQGGTYYTLYTTGIIGGSGKNKLSFSIIVNQ
jgi:hypothetical protein